MNKQTPFVFSKLIKGKYKLSFYWYSYTGLLLLNTTFSRISREIIKDTDKSYALWYLVSSVCFILVSIGLWKASNRYNGKKIKKVLSQISAFLIIQFYIVHIVALLWTIFFFV